MSRHQFDLVLCMKQPGLTTGFLCHLCDGRCPICDSFVKPRAEVKVCEGCAQGHIGKRCILCAHHLGENRENGHVAYYCFECVVLDRHREGCPRITNVGSTKADRTMQKKAKLIS